MSEEYRQEIKQLADQIQDERFLCRIYTILLRYVEKTSDSVTRATGLSRICAGAKGGMSTSEQEYKQYITEMVNKITNEKYLRRIYMIVHTLFISEDR